MNRLLEDASRTIASLAAALLLLQGLSEPMRPWVLALRTAVLFCGTWCVCYALAFFISRTLLTEALRRREEAQARPLAERASGGDIARDRAA